MGFVALPPSESAQNTQRGVNSLMIPRIALFTVLATCLSLPGFGAVITTVDSFTKAERVVDNVNDGVAVFGTASTDPSFLGTRRVYANLGAALFGVNETSGVVLSGFSFLNTPSGTFGEAGLEYTALSLNLGPVGAFRVTASADNNSPTRAAIRLTVNGVSQQQNVGGLAFQDYVFNYAAFAGVNFSNITTVDLRIIGTEAGADVVLKNFTASSEVPEPGVSALIGVGLVSLTLLRRRK